MPAKPEHWKAVMKSTYHCSNTTKTNSWVSLSKKRSPLRPSSLNTKLFWRSRVTWYSCWWTWPPMRSIESLLCTCNSSRSQPIMKRSLVILTIEYLTLILLAMISSRSSWSCTWSTWFRSINHLSQRSDLMPLDLPSSTPSSCRNFSPRIRIPSGSMSSL